jgi:hypothetical protein
VLGQIAIRVPGPDDAERVGWAHSVAADEAYGSYFPRGWMLQRNTPAKRAEQWHQLLSESVPEGQVRRRAEHYLWVMEENRRAIAYYRKRGYRPDGAVEHLPTIANFPETRMVWSPQRSICIE